MANSEAGSANFNSSNFMAVYDHYTTQFSTNWIHRAQQTKARLDGFVEDEVFMGERKRWDRLHKQNDREKTERNAPTNPQEAGSDSVWGYRRTFDIANLLDETDMKNLGNLVLPSGEHVKSHAASYSRRCDQIAWQAAIGAVMTGELGTTEEALPNSQIIVNGSTGLTVEKLIAASEILEGADLEEDAPRVIVLSPRQMSNLLNTTKATSADYASVKSLVNGTIDTFMGFKFVKSNYLPLSGGVRQNVCWVKGSIKRFKGAMASYIDKLPEKSHSTQIRSVYDLAAARVYHEGVVRIDCAE